MANVSGRWFFLSLLILAASAAKADVIEVEYCTGVACFPSSSTLYLDGSTSATSFTYGGIAQTLGEGVSATDSFSWSPGGANPFSLTGGNIAANSHIAGSALSAALLEELSFGVTATDSTGVAGTLQLEIQQNITSPGASGIGLITGQSYLEGNCSSNTAGSITGGAQSGGYFIGNFNQQCSTSEFDVQGNAQIPTYAADGDFYEQADFNFAADGGVSESMNLPMGGSVPVPDPQLSSVPEPSSLPMLLAGLGLVGGAFYFGRKKAIARL